MSSGEAQFAYYGSNHTLTKVNEARDHSGFNATVVIYRTALRPKKFAIEGKCGSLFHYLFINKGEHYKILKLCAISPLVLYCYSVRNWLCIN